LRAQRRHERADLHDMAALDAHARTGVTRWRITVGDRADVVFQLRDYFRRLGIAAEVCKPTEIELSTDVVGAELGKHLADWVRVVDVPARFVDKPARLPGLESGASKPPPRLGSLLVGKGFINEEQLTLALNEARERNELLGVVLLRKQWIFEEELARTLSEQLSIPYVSIGRIGVNQEVARLVPRDVGERVAAIPVRADRDAVLVAFADPSDPNAVEAIHEYLGNIQVAVAELSDIRFAWRDVRQPRAATSG
jgi:Type II secretion system (T2SS), protein E, N-terminal domain